VSPKLLDIPYTYDVLLLPLYDCRHSLASIISLS